jgi:hypothetical protein
MCAINTPKEHNPAIDGKRRRRRRTGKYIYPAEPKRECSSAQNQEQQEQQEDIN